MRTLPTDLNTEISAEQFRLCHLITLELTSGTYRYCDYDVDVYYNGDQYNARGIEFDAAQYSLLPKVDEISFEIDNVALEISGIVMNEDVRGKRCTIYRAAMDTNVKVIGIAILFPGILDRIEIDHLRGRFEVYNQFIKWNMVTPRRIHSATCPWTFKDTATCKHVGLGSPVTGTASGGTSTTLIDSGAGWSVDAYKDKKVTITGGTGSGQSRVISSNTSDTLTVDTAWDTTPDSTSVYSIEDWCDRSWDRCDTLSNTPQFGGFRWLLRLVDKSISWGKVLK